MKYKSELLNKLDFIDKSWDAFVSNETESELIAIEEKINLEKNQHTPNTHNVLRFLSKSLKDIKIVILGQDPYPQQGVATGRAFEVGTLRSWQDKFSNVSLKNIIRAIYSAYNNEYLKYSDIKKELGSTFNLKSPDDLFVEWENQGVLLLNTSFTCKIGESNSHEKYWRNFTNKLLHYIADSNSEIIWFLWGANAQAIVKGIDIKHKIESMHPMMCFNKEGRENDFLFGKQNCFNQTKSIINWLG
ncbi:MAG: uracil-DNA glycosylase [Bacteroidales bacterium]|nr:uracil-DNA glycosylase [Bacteroidales bacterium]